ncbi:MAG TPA: 6-phosphogluconolactonase [Candidatus Peribacteraceae bacterium]|nr:6-phosphogluconolactonase [Candidatus Peribacteraceae bacterium]
MHYQFIDTQSADDFTHRAVELLTHHIQRAIETHGSCVMGLSGGSTPRPIYEALGKQPLNWSKVFVFLIDERHVDPSSEDSNQKLVRDTLLKHAHIPEENMVFPDTALPVHDCVKKYAEDLKAQWENRLPDISVLGMGPDGHIASLFPLLTEKETHERALALHTTTDRFAVHDRITVGLHVIAAIDTHLFLLKGDEKKRVWDEMIASQDNLHRWPAKFVIQSSDVTALWTA